MFNDSKLCDWQKANKKIHTNHYLTIINYIYAVWAII